MTHSQVPKFGNWDDEGDVPYTIYFENAGKGKKGSKMNPNDPQQSPEAEMKGQNGRDIVRQKHGRSASRDNVESRKSTDSPMHPASTADKASTYSSHQWHDGVRSGGNKTESEIPKSPEVHRPKHERRRSREEGDLRTPTDSSLRYENAGRRTPMESPLHRYGGLSAGDTPKRVSRQNMGSDRSLEHSPLHPHSQARVGGKSSAVSSPLWERKVSSEGSHGLAPSTPGRSRLRSVKGDDTPDHSPAIPKFGDWDETDPASAEDYSQVFNRVREEKQSDAAKVPVMPTETSYSIGQNRYVKESTKGCMCFPWGSRR